MSLCDFIDLESGVHTKTDLKVHLIWIPKYRKRILLGQVAIRTRDVLRQIATEHEINNMNPSYNKQIYRSQRKGKIQKLKFEILTG